MEGQWGITECNRNIVPAIWPRDRKCSRTMFLFMRMETGSCNELGTSEVPHEWQLRERSGRRGFSVSSPQLWNSLPTVIRLLYNENQLFRKRLKTHYMQQSMLYPLRIDVKSVISTTTTTDIRSYFLILRIIPFRRAEEWRPDCSGRRWTARARLRTLLQLSIQLRIHACTSVFAASFCCLADMQKKEEYTQME